MNIIDKNSVAADITADRRMVIEGGVISFKDTSLGRPTRWNWTFEGGTPSTSNEQNPTVTYSTAGKYKVTLVRASLSELEIEVTPNFVMDEGLILK